MGQFRAFTILALLIAVCGCGGNSASSANTAGIVVTAFPAKADVDAGGSFVLNYFDSGDTTGAGLNASLTGAGSLNATGPSFFGEYTVLYTAPGSPVAVNPISLVGTSASITIASNANSSKNVVVPITLHDNIQFPAQTPPGASAGKFYSYAFTASGGTGTLTYALTSASAPLPSGLTLSTTGVLSGTPTTVGTYSLQIEVIDQATKIVGIARTFTIQVS